MDNETLVPGSGPFSTQPPRRGGGSPIGIILLVILGLGTLIFGLLTIMYASQAATATKILETEKTEAAEAAREEQKKLDEAEFAKINASPFRSYTAPPEFGSFTINFPKSWSSSVIHEATGKQVQLTLHPNFIVRSKGSDAPMATRVVLNQRTKDQYLQQYASLIKNKTLKQADITVSGLPAFDVTGKFTDKKTQREIIVPIRDKVLVFSNEDTAYSSEFAQIVANAKIIP